MPIAMLPTMYKRSNHSDEKQHLSRLAGGTSSTVAPSVGEERYNRGDRRDEPPSLPDPGSGPREDVLAGIYRFVLNSRA